MSYVAHFLRLFLGNATTLQSIKEICIHSHHTHTIADFFKATNTRSHNYSFLVVVGMEALETEPTPLSSIIANDVEMYIPARTHTTNATTATTMVRPYYTAAQHTHGKRVWPRLSLSSSFSIFGLWMVHNRDARRTQALAVIDSLPPHRNIDQSSLVGISLKGCHLCFADCRHVLPSRDGSARPRYY